MPVDRLRAFVDSIAAVAAAAAFFGPINRAGDDSVDNRQSFFHLISFPTPPARRS